MNENKLSPIVQELSSYLHQQFPATVGNIPVNHMLEGIDELIRFPQPRDEFAMSALSGIMCNPISTDSSSADIAERAYCIADALMKERTRQ